MNDLDACTATIVKPRNWAQILSSKISSSIKVALPLLNATSKVVDPQVCHADPKRGITRIQRQSARHLAQRHRARVVREMTHWLVTQHIDEQRSPQHESEKMARMQLYAMGIKGFDASRSIMVSAGVDHQISDTVRVIQKAGARAPRVRGSEYLQRDGAWLELLAQYGHATGSVNLPRLCAGAILADFVLHDAQRAPQPDDVDFECMGEHDREAFLRLIEYPCGIERVHAVQLDDLAAIDADELATRYSQLYRARVQGDQTERAGGGQHSHR